MQSKTNANSRSVSTQTETIMSSYTSTGTQSETNKIQAHAQSTQTTPDNHNSGTQTTPWTGTVHINTSPTNTVNMQQTATKQRDAVVDLTLDKTTRTGSTEKAVSFQLHKLKQKSTKASPSISQAMETVQTDPEQQVELVTPNVPIYNRYSPLADSANTSTINDRNEDRHNRGPINDRHRHRQINPPAGEQDTLDVLIVSSSIGKRLRAQWMYHHKNVKIHLLQQGKDMRAAKEFLEHTKLKAKTLVLLVGSNVLSRNNTTTQCQIQMEELLSTARTVMPDAEIALSQILPRTNCDSFNVKAARFNRTTARHCQPVHMLHFIQHDNLSDSSKRYDGTHLTDPAVGKLVRNIKTTLNPLLGLAPISNYNRNPINESDEPQQQRHSTNHNNGHNYKSPSNTSHKKYHQREERDSKPPRSNNNRTDYRLHAKRDGEPNACSNSDHGNDANFRMESTHSSNSNHTGLHPHEECHSESAPRSNSDRIEYRVCAAQGSEHDSNHIDYRARGNGVSEHGKPAPNINGNHKDIKRNERHNHRDVYTTPHDNHRGDYAFPGGRQYSPKAMRGMQPNELALRLAEFLTDYMNPYNMDNRAWTDT